AQRLEVGRVPDALDPLRRELVDLVGGRGGGHREDSIEGSLCPIAPDRPPVDSGPVAAPRWSRPALRRRRAASKSTTAPATAAFSDSTSPSIGRVTEPSQRATTGSGSPCASAPTSTATAPSSSAAPSGGSPPCPTVASTGTPLRPQPSSTSSSSTDSTTGTRNTEPAVARTVFGLRTSTDPVVSTTPAQPVASATRTSVPALPGSWSETSTGTGRPVECARSSTSDSSAGA